MVGQAVISRIMNSPDFEAFGSTRPRGQNSAAATWQRRLGSKTELEFNPHDGVHQAIGGNMSVVDLSARDPIFFLHHANVDRLWTAWNRRGNANSSEPIWRDFAFNGNFLNADGFALECRRQRARIARDARLSLRRRYRSVRRRPGAADRRSDDRKALGLPAAGVAGNGERRCRAPPARIADGRRHLRRRRRERADRLARPAAFDFAAARTSAR
jgi:hypothetical protein